MLRPGELSNIRLSDLQIAPDGVLIQLRAQKCDKIIRADPWHYIVCGVDATLVFCLACALRTVAVEQTVSLRKNLTTHLVVEFDAKLELAPLFVDVNKAPIPPGLLGILFNVAISATLGGVSELAIRTTGDWRSDAIRRYVGGIMATRSNLFGAMLSASSSSFISSSSSSSSPSSSSSSSSSSSFSASHVGLM